MSLDETDELVDALCNEVLDHGGLEECEDKDQAVKEVKDWALLKGISLEKAQEFAEYVIHDTGLVYD